MAHSKSAAKRWCFTWNNYSDNDIEYLRSLDLQFLLVAKEVGASGTPHLQGYLEVKKKQRFNQVRALLRNNHVEPARGDVTSQRIYCNKENIAIENGTPGVAGKKTLSAAVDDLKGGMSCSDMFEAHGDQWIRNKRKIEEVVAGMVADDTRKKLRTEEIVLRAWQQRLMDDIEKYRDNDRVVLWYWDEEGNKGKTKMSTHLVLHHGAALFANGKNADIAHAWNGEPIVVFDYSRTNQEHLNYGILEAVKNGVVFSPKYQSTSKMFPPPTVICFANFEPDKSKLSNDRWRVVEIKSIEYIVYLYFK